MLIACFDAALLGIAVHASLSDRMQDLAKASGVEEGTRRVEGNIRSVLGTIEHVSDDFTHVLCERARDITQDNNQCTAHYHQLPTLISRLIELGHQFETQHADRHEHGGSCAAHAEVARWFEHNATGLHDIISAVTHALAECPGKHLDESHPVELQNDTAGNFQHGDDGDHHDQQDYSTAFTSHVRGRKRLATGRSSSSGGGGGGGQSHTELDMVHKDMNQTKEEIDRLKLQIGLVAGGRALSLLHRENQGLRTRVKTVEDGLSEHSDRIGKLKRQVAARQWRRDQAGREDQHVLDFRNTKQKQTERLWQEVAKEEANLDRGHLADQNRTARTKQPAAIEHHAADTRGTLSNQHHQHHQPQAEDTRTAGTLAKSVFHKGGALLKPGVPNPTELVTMMLDTMKRRTNSSSSPATTLPFDAFGEVQLHNKMDPPAVIQLLAWADDPVRSSDEIRHCISHRFHAVTSVEATATCTTHDHGHNHGAHGAHELIASTRSSHIWDVNTNPRTARGEKCTGARRFTRDELGERLVDALAAVLYREGNRQFIDDDFTADRRSLYSALPQQPADGPQPFAAERRDLAPFLEGTADVVWKRPSEMETGQRPIVWGSVDPEDIRQGSASFSLRFRGRLQLLHISLNAMLVPSQVSGTVISWRRSRPARRTPSS